MRDLTSSRLIILKAVLFVAMGAIAATLLIARDPEPAAVALLVLCIWAFARAYYFAFYVIERYVDPSFRFSGIGSAIAFLARRKRP